VKQLNNLQSSQITAFIIQKDLLVRTFLRKVTQPTKRNHCGVLQST